MVDFEELRFPQSLAQFQVCNKESLVRGLWREHSSNQRVLRLMSRIMLQYEVVDNILWQSLLYKMLDLKMFSFLLTLLGPLSSASFVRSLVSLMYVKTKEKIISNFLHGNKGCWAAVANSVINSLVRASKSPEKA